jgi:hypothetical protein
MAKLYGEIAKSALLTLDKSFSRALGQPLDASEVYYSLDAAKTYAATPAAYIGQKIVVIEDNKVTHYSIEDAAGTLKEVGVRPSGDGKSITVSTEGVVSIIGAANADSLTLPRMKEDKSGIEWVPVSAVVKGDGNDNTTYEFTELTKGEGDAAEVYGFKIKTLFNNTEVEGGSFEIAFDVYTKSEADAKFLAKADYTPYDDTDLADRVTAVENNKADKATTVAGYGITDAYTKTEVDTAINDAKKSILGEGVAEAYDTLKEIQDILNGTNGEAIDGLIETAAANKADIATLKGDANTEGSVAKKIADAVAPLATTEALEAVRATAEAAQTEQEVADTVAVALESYYTKTEIDNKNYATETDVADTYATKQEVEDHKTAAEAAYAKKATTLLGYGITDTYTATQTDEAIAAKIREMTGGESAADVLVALNNYKASNDREVWGDEFVTSQTVEGKYEPTYSGDSRIDKLVAKTAAIEAKVGTETDGVTESTGLFLKVEQAQSTAAAGVAAAAAAQQTADSAVAGLATLIEGQVKTNKNDIAVIKAIVTGEGSATPDTSHATRLGVIESYVTTHTGEFNTLKGRVDANEQAITTKANSADVYTKTAADALLAAKADANTTYTKDEVDAKVQEAIDAIPDVNFDPYLEKTVFTEYQATIETALGKKADAATINETIAGITAELDTKATAANVYTKAEADAQFMTETQVKATVDKVVADVTDQDTIEGLVTLVEYVHENAGDLAQLVSDVDKQGKAIAANTTAIEANSVAIANNATAIAANTAGIATNASAITAITAHSSTEIEVAARTGEGETGVALNIKELNVNKLVQTPGEMFIISGGNAAN